MTTLDGILDEKEEKQEVEAPKEEVAEAPPVDGEKNTSRRKAHQDRETSAQAEGAGKERDPVTGQFVPKKEEKVEVKAEAPPKQEQPKQDMSDKERALLYTAQEERRKRQELEKKLAEMGSKEPPKTFWDDPETRLAKHLEEIQSVATNTRLQTAEAIARSKYSDFQEKVDVFAQIVQQTPGLAQQWLASPDPAEFAYKLGKNHKELQEAGNLDALRAKMEKEIRLKVENEMKANAEKLAAERAAIPPSLSDARGTTSHRPVWNGPPPLEDILAK